MSKEKPPLGYTSLFSCAADRGNSRIGPFTSDQILQLHEVHANLQAQNILSELKFDYGHNHRRATFMLVTPASERDDLNVALLELRESDGMCRYIVGAMAGKTSCGQQEVSAARLEHLPIPPAALIGLQEKINDMNCRDFSQPRPGAKIVRLADRRGGPK